MILFPKQSNAYTAPAWNQSGDSDLNGSLWSSTNLDLSENDGRVRLGKRLLLATGTDDQADLTSYPIGFKFFTDDAGGKNWTIAGGYIWNSVYSTGTGAGITGSWIKDTHTSLTDTVSSSRSDLEVFNNELYVTTNNSIWYLTGASAGWTAIATLGSSGSATTMTVYGGKLYIGYGSTVRSINADHTPNSTGAYTVSVPDPDSYITFIRSAASRIWIGVVNNRLGKGYIYEWDGVSTQVTKAYRLESQGALACVVKDDIPYIMDCNGALLSWNGGTFVKLAKLNRVNNKLLLKTQSSLNERFIHPNGMSLIQGRINILINGQNGDGTLEETIPSGIYEYDTARGLTQKHAIATAKVAGTVNDFCHTNLKGVGALTEYNSTVENSFLVGASYYSDATTVKAGIFYNNLASQAQIQRAGSFVTSKQFGTDQLGNAVVKANWDSFNTLYRNLLASTDKIVPKYRISEQDPVQATITWTSTTTFTVANASVVVSNYWTAGIGGEVEILNGVGAGVCSHITGAVLNAGTWTVTVDEVHTGATGTAIARFQNWKKISVIDQTANNNEGQNSDTISESSIWIQFKVWMKFTGKDEIERLIITNTTNLPA
jgi:hypothetical protein